MSKIRIVYVDIDSHFYMSSEGEYDKDIPPDKRRGWPIRKDYKDEHEQLRITKERNGMYHIEGKYGNLGWVYPSAIVEWL